MSAEVKATLEAMASACETQDAPYDWLDGEIWRAVNGWPESDGHRFGHDFVWWRRTPDDSVAFEAPPAYTASLDAALTLVPEMMLTSLLFDPRCSRAVAHVRTRSILDPDKEEWDGYAKTQALALCAAALRARASEAGQ